MVSLGAEWDTNLLVYFPQGALPKGIHYRYPFYKNGKISITLEWWKPRNLNKSDCIASLEVQMGVFHGDSSFNLEEFVEVCQIWTQFWENIIGTKKIYINDIPYDVLIYSSDNIPNSLRYKDCARTQLYNGTDISYTDTFHDKNVIGTTQITIGIKLPQVISLFSYVSLLYEGHTDMQLFPIYASYVNAGYYAYSVGIRDLSLIAFMLLISHYIYVMKSYEQLSKGEYAKSFFGIKLRTNLYVIYESLGNPKKEVRGLLDYLIENEEGLENVCSNFLKTFFKPQQGYVIIDSDKKMSFSELIIIGNQLQNSKEINIFIPPWGGNLPHVQDEKYMINLESKGYSLDYGEWNIEKKNTIHMEIRAVPNLLSITKGGSVSDYYSLPVNKMCTELKYLIGKVLNKALEVDPSIILPPLEDSN